MLSLDPTWETTWSLSCSVLWKFLTFQSFQVSLTCHFSQLETLPTSASPALRFSWDINPLGSPATPATPSTQMMKGPPLGSHGTWGLPQSTNPMMWKYLLFAAVFPTRVWAMGNQELHDGPSQASDVVVKFAHFALVFWGLQVRILGMDLHTVHQAMLRWHPTYKVEEDWHRC